MNKFEKGLSPILCSSSNDANKSHYFVCPICRNNAGGILTTGNGEDDWATPENNFCNRCGQKFDWNNVDWSLMIK